ncbi:MAG TPA: 23S rRNA (guanosine(2251)-2'-O)-methyltransferase RlmB [Clostridiaceae bacterium]|jgi:23S rRNA (guanosine2251-2'-O)-methyltransferase|nr:23S rRNA (guanosine(2251)-2'-O)-methyltransferase RlmB [Clostridiaceae bacterium]
MTRDERELCQLEGRNPIAEALAAGRSINRVYTLQSARNVRSDTTLARLIADCKERGAVITYVNRATLDAMATSGAHQGIIADIAPYEYADLADMLAQYELSATDPFLILLDHIQDAHNLGSILRIADGAGVNAVVIPQRRSVMLNAAVAKASAGAVEHVPLCRVINLSKTVLDLKEQGFWIYGTTAEGGIAYDQVDFSGKIALVIGSEGQGISKKLLDHCDFLLTIPLYGKVNSLNAAVASGIIAFEAARQRRHIPR